MSASHPLPRVLVCDDEPVLRALVRASLEPDYLVVDACDGDESLRLAQELRPDVIVLDMMMPGKSGLEVLTALRADPNLAATPVVMLTARAQTADRIAAVEVGADRYLAKPFSPVQLATTVTDLLSA
jgi:two-component system phosphate regulon response regulator PhoB